MYTNVSGAADARQRPGSACRPAPGRWSSVLADRLDEHVEAARGDHHVVDLRHRGERVGHDVPRRRRPARRPSPACGSPAAEDPSRRRSGSPPPPGARATRWRTGGLREAHRPRDRGVRAAPVVLQLLDDRLAHVVEQGRGRAPAVTHPRLAEFEAESTRIRCPEPSLERGFRRRSRTDASKYVVQGSSILAAEFTRPEAAMSTPAPSTPAGDGDPDEGTERRCAGPGCPAWSSGWRPPLPPTAWRRASG
jgi:hypothetical protein